MIIRCNHKFHLLEVDDLAIEASVVCDRSVNVVLQNTVGVQSKARSTSNKEHCGLYATFHLSLNIFFLFISIGFLAADTAFSTTERSGSLILVS